MLSSSVRLTVRHSNLTAMHICLPVCLSAWLSVILVCLFACQLGCLSFLSACLPVSLVVCHSCLPVCHCYLSVVRICLSFFFCLPVWLSFVSVCHSFFCLPVWLAFLFVWQLVIIVRTRVCVCYFHQAACLLFLMFVIFNCISMGLSFCLSICLSV